MDERASPSVSQRKELLVGDAGGAGLACGGESQDVRGGRVGAGTLQSVCVQGVPRAEAGQAGRQQKLASGVRSAASERVLPKARHTDGTVEGFASHGARAGHVDVELRHSGRILRVRDGGEVPGLHDVPASGRVADSVRGFADGLGEQPVRLLLGDEDSGGEHSQPRTARHGWFTGAASAQASAGAKTVAGRRAGGASQRQRSCQRGRTRARRSRCCRTWTTFFVGCAGQRASAGEQCCARATRSRRASKIWG